MNPINMAIPPNAGVETLCILRLSGASNRSIERLTLIIIGNNIKVIVNAAVIDKIMVMFRRGDSGRKY